MGLGIHGQAITLSFPEIHHEPPKYVMLEPGLVDHLKEPNVTHRIERLGDFHSNCYFATRQLLHVESLYDP